MSNDTTSRSTRRALAQIAGCAPVAERTHRTIETAADARADVSVVMLRELGIEADVAFDGPASSCPCCRRDAGRERPAA